LRLSIYLAVFYFRRIMRSLLRPSSVCLRAVGAARLSRVVLIPADLWPNLCTTLFLLMLLDRV